MRIGYCADMHCEHWGRGFNIKNMPEMDLLVIAGDFASSPSIARDFLLPVQKSKKVGHVVYVLGNHEFYTGALSNALFVYGDMLIESGLDDFVSIVEKRRFYPSLLTIPLIPMSEQVVILGTTLWSDFEGGNPLSMLACKRGLRDFHHIKRIPNGDRCVWPEDIYKEFVRNEKWLGEELASLKRYANPCATIVVTHHSPSFAFRNTRGANSLDGGFNSNMDGVILDRGPDLWIFGHTHMPVDTTIGHTRFVNNPRGYPREDVYGPDNGFNIKVVDVPLTSEAPSRSEIGAQRGMEN